MKDEEEQHEDEGIGGDDSDLLATLDSKNADKEEPEIVGLTIEEFYPRDEAKKLAKEILSKTFKILHLPNLLLNQILYRLCWRGESSTNQNRL